MTDPHHAWICEQTVDQSLDAFVYADRSGIIRLWNAGATAMFGYSADDALGQSLDLIIPERFRARHWEGYQRVMETGVTRYGRELLAVPAVRKDGARLSIEFTIVLLRETSGDIGGAMATIRDVTARWEEQKALRARLAQLEAGGKS